MRHVAHRGVVEPRTRVAASHVVTSEQDRLAERAWSLSRSLEVKQWELVARAGGGVYGEDRHAVRPLDELHRCRVAWVDLDRQRNAITRDEVDPVDADETELPRYGTGERTRGCHQLGSPMELRVVRCRQDVSAVPESTRAERLVAYELSR